MSITSYKRLTVLFAVGIILVLGLMLRLGLELRIAQLDKKESEQSTWVAVRDLDNCRNWALHAEPPKAVGYLDMLEQSPPRSWTAHRGNIGRVIEIERASAIREVIAYLRNKTGEDLGDDPKKWIEKYGKPVASHSAAGRLPQYQDFAVTNIFKGKPATVDLSSNPEARHYRTELRRQAAEGPDFAGHYKIAIWGCGSESAAFAIVDSQTGRVYFPPELPFVTWTGWEGTNFGLQYQIDSKLLVLHGSPEEKPQIGTFYYVWQTNKLRLIWTELQK